MSHIVNVETEIRDLGALIAAASALGWEFREDQKSYRWYGQWVGDTPMPRGVKEEDLGKCAHAIRIPGCAYEVGVVQVSAGVYELRYDFYAYGGLEARLGTRAGPLLQEYAIQKTLKQAALTGRTVLSRRTLADGTAEIVLMGR